LVTVITGAGILCADTDGQGVTVAMAVGVLGFGARASTKPMPATKNKPNDEKNIVNNE